MTETRDHAGFKRLGTKSRDYSGYVTCPFCERDVEAVKSTFQQQGKRCLCGAKIWQTTARMEEPRARDWNFKSPSHKAISKMSDEQKIKICTAFSLSGDITELCRVYEANEQFFMQEIMSWLKTKHIREKVLENLKSTSDGKQYMKHSYIFDCINNHENNNPLDPEGIYTVRDVC